MPKFVRQLRFFFFFPKFSPFLPSATKTILSCCCHRRAKLGCLVLQRAKSRQRGCFQRARNAEKGSAIHKQPFFRFKNPLFPFSIAAIPIGFTRPPAGRHRTRLHGRRPSSALISRREPITATISLQRRRKANGHRGPQLWSQPKPQPAEGGKATRAEAEGVVPAAPFVPTTQSRPLFYGHEKFSWTVKISHSQFWYEAPQYVLLSGLT